jgi:hypothetical protein
VKVCNNEGPETFNVLERIVESVHGKQSRSRFKIERSNVAFFSREYRLIVLL